MQNDNGVNRFFEIEPLLLEIAKFKVSKIEWAVPEDDDDYLYGDYDGEIERSIFGRLINEYEKLPQINAVKFLLENRQYGAVAKNIGNLSELREADYIDIANQLLASPEPSLIAENLERFRGLDHFNVLRRLLELREFEAVSENLDKFICQINFQELALDLIKNGLGFSLARNLPKFIGLDHRKVVILLIDSGSGGAVAANVRNFSNVDHSIVARDLISAGFGKIVGDYLSSFQGLDFVLVSELLFQVSDGYVVIQNLEKFYGIDHGKLVGKITSGEFDTLINNVHKFDVAVRPRLGAMLVSTSDESARQALANHEKFNISLGLEMAQLLLKYDRASALVAFLDKFTGLNEDIATQLVRSGRATKVARCLDSFDPLDRGRVATISASSFVPVGQLIQ